MRIEPFKVLRVLNLDVRILHDDHEYVLYKRHYKEDEAVHEELCVEEVCISHWGVSVIKGVSSLHREHSVETFSEVAKAILELPENAHWQKANSDVDRQYSYPDLNDGGDSVLKCTHDNIEISCVGEVLCYRGPCAEGSNADKNLTVAQCELLGEDYEQRAEDAAQISKQWDDVPGFEKFSFLPKAQIRPI